MTTAHGQRILVAVDGSEPSERALQLASRLARCSGWSLDVVTVVETPPEEVFTREGIAHVDVEAVKARAHDEILNPALARLGPDVPVIRAHVEIGHVVTSLAEMAEQPDVAMVVVGRTGKGPLRRVIEGSVSRGLSALCKTALTIVP